MNISEKEQRILEYWKKTKCFETQVPNHPAAEEYVFYDGPPFATGTPHYGHILAGTIKDVITRYHAMHGKNVPRQFGWDCHGLPVEHLVDEMLKIQDKKEKVDLTTYNQLCRSVVMKCEQDWEGTVDRMGRWIDFQHSYKTMDLSYMNELWKIFAELYKKNLMYKSFKVMPFSLALGTPLSNFEANLNYKTVSQTDAYVLFPLTDFENTYFMAWTTTPWTLLSHVALCVHPELTYIQYEDTVTKKKYIVSESYLIPDTWIPAKTYLGKDISGMRYQAEFSCYPGEFKVLCDTYVKADTGTGVIHLAPSFGEDDFRVCKEYGISVDTFPCPLTKDGYFTDQVPMFEGQYVFDTEKPILQWLKPKQLLWKQGSTQHSYPYCWRTDTPLVYRTVHSWFLRVEAIKEQMLSLNQKVHWIPENMGQNRFHQWLEQAKDWAISRTRFWGTPIPVWISEDGEEILVVSSKEELYEKTGIFLNDLHRESVDSLEIPSSQGKGMLRRIPEVFDCWYESGAVPIVQSRLHGNLFRPAEFVAEGVDQTRGWFYTMLVLSTALYSQAPYKHVICSGLVLAEDGKKMSKRWKNYTDPNDIMKQQGADALRMYLLDSPVVKGETLRFQDTGVSQILKDIHFPILNAIQFWKENHPSRDIPAAENPMDRWIEVYMHEFVANLKKEMDQYRLWNVVGYIKKAVDQITNTYVRMNRYRCKQGDKKASGMLYWVLDVFARSIAPIAPFLAERMYQELHDTSESVHHTLYPNRLSSSNSRKKELEYMNVFQEVVEILRKTRIQYKIPARQPIRYVKVIYPSLDCQGYLERYLLETLQRETNLKEVVFETDLEPYVTKQWVPDKKSIGQKFGKQSKQILQDLQVGVIHPELLEGVDIRSQYIPKTNTDLIHIAVEKELVVLVDIQVTPELQEEGFLREMVALIHRVRRETHRKAWDVCQMYVTPLQPVYLQEQLQNLVGPNSQLLFEHRDSVWKYQTVCASVSPNDS